MFARSRSTGSSALAGLVSALLLSLLIHHVHAGVIARADVSISHRCGGVKSSPSASSFSKFSAGAKFMVSSPGVPSSHARKTVYITRTIFATAASTSLTVPLTSASPAPSSPTTLISSSSALFTSISSTFVLKVSSSTSTPLSSSTGITSLISSSSKSSIASSTTPTSISISSSTPSPSSTAVANSTASSGYTLIADYSGDHFFDHWNTFTGADPTNGAVNYTDMRTAAAADLIGFMASSNSTAGGDASSKHVYIGVDHTTPNAAHRNSVRLEGKDTFNPGTLAVLDVRHVPAADGTWPAVWFLGDVSAEGTWPANGGESDWLEWVNAADANSMTLHTAPGCTVANMSATTTSSGTKRDFGANVQLGGTGISVGVGAGPGSNTPGTSLGSGNGNIPFLPQLGTLKNSNCNAGNPWPGTEGCSITVGAPDSSSQHGGTGPFGGNLSQGISSGTDPFNPNGPNHVNAIANGNSASSSLATAGQTFNAQGGGVYAHHWTASGVTVWLFAHDSVPADLAAGNPDPESWTQTPLARFASASTSSTSSSPSSSGASCDFTTSLSHLKPIINIDFCGDWAGAPAVWKSSGAAQRTGASNCAAYVAANPDKFVDAYFEIASYKVFGKAGTAGAQVGAAKVSSGVTVEAALPQGLLRVLQK